jgi:hypothetical protein
VFTISARNVNDAYRKGLRFLSKRGSIVPSRNGPVIRANVPVTTVYANPLERVLFDEQRNANPFFHFFEGLWMLNGQNDIATMTQFIKSMAEFSDDGVTFRGAYGYRWRYHWRYETGGEFDQLKIIITMLRNDPQTRRAVIGMWDPAFDLDAKSKDLPCNDMIKLSMVSGALDMVVFNRSNDIVWGAYGANAVHMSMLHEYLAAMIEVPVGRYYQISTDFHAYTQVPYAWRMYFPLEVSDAEFIDPYSVRAERMIQSCPLVTNIETFDHELARFMERIRPGGWNDDEVKVYGWNNPIFPRVAIPLYRAHRAIKQGNDSSARTILMIAQAETPHDNDWLLAAEQWLTRREARLAKRT